MKPYRPEFMLIHVQDYYAPTDDAFTTKVMYFNFLYLSLINISFLTNTESVTWPTKHVSVNLKKIFRLPRRYLLPYLYSSHVTMTVVTQVSEKAKRRKSKGKITETRQQFQLSETRQQFKYLVSWSCFTVGLLKAVKL